MCDLYATFPGGLQNYGSTSGAVQASREAGLWYSSGHLILPSARNAPLLSFSHVELS